MFNTDLVVLQHKIQEVSTMFTLESFLQDKRFIPKCRRAPLGVEPLRHPECQQQIIAALHWQLLCSSLRSSTVPARPLYVVEQELSIIKGVICLNLFKEYPELVGEKNFAFTPQWRVICWDIQSDEDSFRPIQLYVTKDCS